MNRSVQQMIDEARAEIVGHSPSEALRRADEDNALIVDIRDVRELQREGVVPGAHHAPRGMLEFWVDPESPYHKPVFAEDREFILYCASGGRTSLSTKTLNDMGLTRASHVETGFQGWRDDGLPIVSYDEWSAARER